jgi:hypothetical protein
VPAPSPSSRRRDYATGSRSSCQLGARASFREERTSSPARRSPSLVLTRRRSSRGSTPSSQRRLASGRQCTCAPCRTCDGLIDCSYH